jgi:hypothetical protein
VYTGRRGMYTGFWWGGKKERNQCDELAEEGRIILNWNLKIQAGWNCIVFHVTQDMDTWLVIVTCVINCSAPEICKLSLHQLLCLCVMLDSTTL